MSIEAEARNVNVVEEMGREIGKHDISIPLQGLGPHVIAVAAALHNITA